jgi:type II secretory pathway component PulF
MSLLAALNSIAAQTPKKNSHSVIKRIIEALKEGQTLSSALAKFPQVFSSFYVSIVKAGEIGGFLDNSLARLADYLENEEELRAKTRAALAYPLLIAGVGIATVLILLNFVIPRLLLVFEDMDMALPMPTLMLISLSKFMRNWWGMILAIVFFLIFIYRRISKTKESRYSLDLLKLKVPVLGSIIQEKQIERFCRTLAALLESGVSVLTALQVVSETLENSVIKNELDLIQSQIKDGISLSGAMQKSTFFPAMVANIVTIGEKSGSLEKVLLRIATGYERHIDRLTKTFVSLLEPTLILVMGSLVAFIVAAMLLPIFQINLMVR